MGQAGDYTRKVASDEALKALKAFIIQQNMSTSTNSSGNGRVGCLNESRTKVKFDDGTEWPCTVIGNPPQCCFVQQVSPGQYLAVGPKSKFTQVDGTGIKGYVLEHQDNPPPPFFTEGFRVKDVKKTEIYNVPDTFTIVGDINIVSNFMSIKFTPDGKSIAVVHYETFIDSQDVRFYWGILKNFRLVDGAGNIPNTVQGTIINGSYLVSASNLPSSSDPGDPPLMTACGEWATSGTRTMNFEVDDDPGGPTSKGERRNYNFTDMVISIDSSGNYVLDILSSYESIFSNIIAFREQSEIGNFNGEPLYCLADNTYYNQPSTFTNASYTYGTWSPTETRNVQIDFNGTSVNFLDPDPSTCTLLDGVYVLCHCSANLQYNSSVTNMTQDYGYFQMPVGNTFFPPSIDTTGLITGKIGTSYMDARTAAANRFGQPYLENQSHTFVLFSVNKINSVQSTDISVSSTVYGSYDVITQHNDPNINATSNGLYPPAYWLTTENKTGVSSINFEFAGATNFVEAGFRNGNTTIGYVDALGTSGFMLNSPYTIQGTPVTQLVAVFTDTHIYYDSVPFESPIAVKPTTSEKFIAIADRVTDPIDPTAITLQNYNFDQNKQSLLKGHTISGNMLDPTSYSLYDWAIK